MNFAVGAPALAWVVLAALLSRAAISAYRSETTSRDA